MDDLALRFINKLKDLSKKNKKRKILIIFVIKSYVKITLIKF